MDIKFKHFLGTIFAVEKQSVVDILSVSVALVI